MVQYLNRVTYPTPAFDNTEMPGGRPVFGTVLGSGGQDAGTPGNGLAGRLKLPMPGAMAGSTMESATAPLTPDYNLTPAPQRPAPPSVSQRLDTLLAADSPYMQRARTQGLQFANRRGLMNSSIAAGAGQAAAIDAALPIAQADAGVADAERARQSQEYMQLRGIEAERGLQERSIAAEELLQRRDQEVRQLMQTQNLEFQDAWNEANRRQQVHIARETAVRDINAQYQRWISAIALNTDIPAEAREAYQENFAFIRDQSMEALASIYDFEPVWESARRPEGG